MSRNASATKGLSVPELYIRLTSKVFRGPWETAVLLWATVMLMVLGCRAFPLGPEPSQPAEQATPSPPATVPVSTGRHFITPSPTPTPSPTATPTANVRLQLAREAAQVGNVELALLHYQALADHPEFGEEALFELGRLLAQEEMWTAAQAAWETYLDRYPESPRAPFVHFRLGRLLAALGLHEQAVEHFMAYDAARDVADDKVALELARSLDALERPDEAVEQYRRVYDHPASDRVTRALVARTLGDRFAAQEAWDEALLWYRRALDDSRIPWFRAELIEAMAKAEMARQNRTEAVRLWRLLVDEYPQTASAYRALAALEEAGTPASQFQAGIVFYHNKDWNAAVAALYESLEKEADRAQAHWYAALAYKGAGNWEAAWQELGTLIETHPESNLCDDAWLERGRVRRAQGLVNAALEAYRRAADDFPDGNAAPVALWESAQLLAATQPEEARALYLELADRYPQSDLAPQALWQAGWLAYQTGQYDHATAAWERLADFPEDTSRARFWLGKAYLAAGNPQQATEVWRTLSAGTDYYALRARANLAGVAWQARPYQDPIFPPTPDEEEWLQDTFGLDPASDWASLLPQPLLERGAELEQMGLAEEARSLYRQMVMDMQEQPDRLYAAARFFAQTHPSVSILAARLLLDRLGESAESAPLALAQLAYPLHYTPLLLAEARERNLDPLLLAAVIYQESRWEPVAESSAAARGLMQIIPDTGQWIAQQLGLPFAPRYLFRPVVSLKFGAYYLDWLLQQFDNNVFYALAGYNAGPNRVPNWADADVDVFVENISLAETRTYIETVYQHWFAYHALYGTEP